MAKPDASARGGTATAAAVLACLAAVQLAAVSVDLPLLRLGRNALAPATPPPVAPKYACGGSLASKLTVVVTVKDACSQMPGFVKALERVVGTDVARRRRG